MLRRELAQVAPGEIVIMDGVRYEVEFEYDAVQQAQYTEFTPRYFLQSLECDTGLDYYIVCHSGKKWQRNPQTRAYECCGYARYTVMA